MQIQSGRTVPETKEKKIAGSLCARHKSGKGLCSVKSLALVFYGTVLDLAPKSKWSTRVSTAPYLHRSLVFRRRHYLALPESGPVAAVNKEDDGVHGREVVLPHLHTGEILVPVIVLWMAPIGFKCGSGSSILGQCGSGSRVLITKNCEILQLKFF